MPDSRLTDADSRALREIRVDIATAVASRKAAIARRDALLRRLRDQGVGVTELATAVALHRSQVNRIVTESSITEQD